MFPTYPGHCSLRFRWFLSLLWVVSSHACAEQYFAEYFRRILCIFLSVQGFFLSVLLSPFWSSLLKFGFPRLSVSRVHQEIPLFPLSMLWPGNNLKAINWDNLRLRAWCICFLSGIIVLHCLVFIVLITVVYFSWFVWFLLFYVRL